MLCESYRQPLSDAACSGEALPRELVEHLDDCNDCAFAFACERALFASIDRSLHAAANSEAPPSLVPRVRAQIDATPVRTFWRSPARAWAAGGLALLVIGFAYLAVRSPAVRHSDSRAIVVTPTLQTAVTNEPTPLLPRVSAPARSQQMKRNQVLVPETNRRRVLEVLVSADEKAEFERYAAIWQVRHTRKSVPAAVSADLGDGIKPLEIAELQLGLLAIEPLEDGGAE
jgi:hypothetical protein